MPFGLVFGAVFFLATAVGALAGLTGGTGLSTRLLSLGAAWIAAGLGIGLVLRQRWARWAGVAFALFLALAGAALVSARGSATDFALFLGAIATLVLLVSPPAGDPRRGLGEGVRPWRRSGRILGWTTLAAIALFVVAGVGAVRRLPAADPQEPPRPAAQFPAATPARLEWLEFGPGLERAKATGKPVFVDFYATWCGPCKMMERETFRNAEVSRRLSEIVAVRVDSEGTENHSGPAGSALAARFHVQGYPTLVVLDPGGREVARQTGFMPPEEFADWLARAVVKASAGARGRA